MTDDRAWTGRVFIGVSLDGFIARPDGDIGWLTDPPAGREHARIESSTEVIGWDEFFGSIDHLVMGRGTYEKVLTFDEWPYAGKRVVVLSTTLETDDDRVVIARTLDEALGLLGAGGARQVYVDGGQVIQAFLRAGLVDEITIAWAPVLIGGGLPLFGALERDVHLVLTASNASSGGMVHATYRVERGAGSPAPPLAGR